MFISKTEKEHLLDQVKLISALIKDMSLAATEITMIKAKVKVLEGIKEQQPKRKHTMTPEGRAKMSQMMKDRHAQKKLEKQNANSVSNTSI